jgi:hypothetical protein
MMMMIHDSIAVIGRLHAFHLMRYWMSITSLQSIVVLRKKNCTASFICDLKYYHDQFF